MTGATWDEGTLLAALRDAVLVTDVRGRIVYANPAAATMTGRSMLELIGMRGEDIVPARWRALFSASYSRTLAEPETATAGVLRYPLLRPDGTEVEVAVTFNVIDPPGGGGVLVVGSLRDARDLNTSERQTALLERLLALLTEGGKDSDPAAQVLDAVAQIVSADAACLWLIDPAGERLHCASFWSEPDAELWAFERQSRGLSREQGEGIPGRVLATGEAVEVGDLHVEPGFARADTALAADLRSAVAFPLHANGRIIGVVELYYRDIGGRPRVPTTTLVEMGREVAIFIERRLGDEHLAELLAREQEAREEAESAHQRLEFLLAAGAHIAASLDDAEVLDRLARLAVPMLGDLCAVDLLDEDGTSLRRVLVAHTDPDVEARIGDAVLGRVVDIRTDHPLARVLRSGEPTLWERLTVDHLKAGLQDDELVEAAQQLELGSQVTVPLSSRGRTLGALSLLTMGPRGRYDKTDLPLAMELGRQAGLAIDNGRQYQRERTVVESLQRAFLPDRLPVFEGYQLAARYLGGPAGEIGGDWYDAFPMADGAFGLVIGDVGGHGLPAAATMGQLRNALRALALTGEDPADVCNRLDRHFHELEPGQFATLCFAVLHPATGRFVYATAGHVPVLMLERDGSGCFLHSTRGAPLGTHPLASTDQLEVVVPPGATLLFYTDGLVEDRTRPITEGLADLEAAAAARIKRGVSLDDLADGVLIDRLSGVRRRDDVALLALRRD